MKQILFLNKTLWLKVENCNYYEAYDSIGSNMYVRHVPGSYGNYCTVEINFIDDAEDDTNTTYFVKCIIKDEFIPGIGKITLKQLQNASVEVAAYAFDRKSYCGCCIGNTFLQTNHKNE